MSGENLRGGLHWMAWFAFEGDEPTEWIERYVAKASDELLAITADPTVPLDRATEEKIANAALFLTGLGASLRGEAPIRTCFQKARAGKPINTKARARMGHRAASIVERLAAEGVKKEAAIQEASAETGLSRAEIFRWLKQRRDFREWAESQQKPE